MRALPCLALSVCLLLGACDDAPPPQAAPTADPNPLPAGADALARSMHEKAAQFAQQMTPATPLFRGRLPADQHQDFQAVLQAGHCFKVLGVGGEGVEDLDLLLFSPEGVLMQQDILRDAFPVLGITHDICPQQPGAYRVQVKMFAGTGEFGVQVFESQ